MRKLTLILLIITALLLVGCEEVENAITYQPDINEETPPIDIVIAPPPTPVDNSDQLRVIAVSAATWHTLAILEDGSLWAWGDTDKPNEEELERRYNSWGFVWAGRLGDGTNESRLLPVKIMDNVIHAVAGEHHSLAIDTDGVLWAWGRNGWDWAGNDLGFLGDGTTEDRQTSVRIMENVVYATIAPFNSNAHVGYGPRSYAITADGRLWGWGASSDFEEISGPIGDGTSESRNSPVRIMDNVVSVTPTFNGGYATTSDGTEWWWGTRWESHEETNELWYEIQLYPIRVSEIEEPPFRRERFVGFEYEIDESGTLWTWGQNRMLDGRGGSGGWPLVGDGTVTFLGDTAENWGELIGEDNVRHTPVRIMDNVISVKTVRDTVFVIDSDRTLWAWGYNTVGQLGDGTTEARLSPVRIMDNVAYITSNYFIDHGWVSFINTFVITNDGELYGWGNAESFGSGLLGDGTSEHRLLPVRIIFE